MILTSHILRQWEDVISNHSMIQSLDCKNQQITRAGLLWLNTAKLWSDLYEDSWVLCTHLLSRQLPLWIAAWHSREGRLLQPGMRKLSQGTAEQSMSYGDSMNAECIEQSCHPCALVMLCALTMQTCAFESMWDVALMTGSSALYMPSFTSGRLSMG